MLTIPGALGYNGMLAAMTVKAATDREVFLAYLDEVLCPRLQPGQVVVMDNLSAHKVKGVRERIEQAGASLLYLPPYSPDLNPIEKAWGKTQTGTAFRPGPYRRSTARRHRKNSPHHHPTRRTSTRVYRHIHLRAWERRLHHAHPRLSYTQRNVITASKAVTVTV